MEPVASDFDYPLDPALIAQHPLARRDESRLMVLRRRTGRTELRVFADLPSLLAPGDLLVVNNTRVIPARFFCRRSSGGRIEGLFLQQAHQVEQMRQPRQPRHLQKKLGGLDAPPGEWVVLLKGANRCRVGERLELIGGGAVELELLANQGQGQWLVAAHPSASAAEVLARAGHTPLPPYIRRPLGAGPTGAGPGGPDQPASGEACDFEPLGGRPVDRDRYQTVYAVADGAVAAPTAGLHFTPELIAALAASGVETVAVTLHVGLGTFAPVKVENLAEHRMHSEWYEMPAATASALNAARDEQRRIIAVGTTSVRVLESVVAPGGRFEPGSGWTDIFIRPPASFLATDAMITNFHLPRSTLLMLVSAFCRPGRTDGIEMIRAAYARAAAERFRFFSYGDAMLIE
jgi:S-adenosylmethionine:tRNA ribosyltransferase-isomerase